MSKSQAGEKLERLVREFAELEREGKLEQASEATARSWLERFLGAFGWNPSDPRQVIQEFRIQGRAARRLAREGSPHRRPDYALVVNDQPVLYIDAKKFKVDLEHDGGVAYQVRSYGWSAGFRLSYAFDFEHVAVWDCRVPPKADDAASVSRVLLIRYTDYVKNLDLLWEYFAREAIVGGSLARLHPDDKPPRGSMPLDEEFEERLSEWRREIAKLILHHGKIRDPRLISAAAQRILDRVIFLRICEEIGLEELGSLHSMVNGGDGFWASFMEAHEKRYRKAYDGILFPHSEEDDPTGVEALLRRWWLKGRAFKPIVDSLYYPNPYRFDVVPVELLGGIYEKYLGKRLRVVGNNVEDEYKPEYQRTKGAVYTPPWVVRRVVGRTLSPLVRGKDPEEILKMRVLDPACGSGSFLLGVYDYLERALIEWFAAHPGDPRSSKFVGGPPEALRLVPSAVRRILDECVFGVDIDAEAVEVARMSMALRYVERTARDEGEEPSDLLRGIGRNVRHGNSLVEPDIAGVGMNSEAVKKTLAFDWKNPRYGFGEVMASGGFDAVVGNPPYIEVKRYKEWMPEMFEYLKAEGRYQTAAFGKTDISIPFIERAVKVLKPHGRVGFIVQNRFFKTEYGEPVRHWLRTNRLLEVVEDFRDLQVFKGRTTYTAILVLQKDSGAIRYRTYAEAAAAEADTPSVEATMSAASLDDAPWSFDQPDLLKVHAALAERHGTIAMHREMQISVGLQVLYGKLYMIEPREVRPLTVKGVNGLGEEVVLERKAMRPLCRNRGFYPFRRDNADAWVIFPYEVEGGQAREILWPEFKKRFDRSARYLEERRRKLKEEVEVPAGSDRWHLYTRPQNLVAQARPKVLFPSTIEDTMAAVDPNGEVYQDNVRINSLSLGGVDVSLFAVGAVLNSTLFSSLGRLKAGLSDSGWRMFNRQFVELVPFPLARLRGSAVETKLDQTARRIAELQETIKGADDEGARQAVRGALSSLWLELDALVEDLYDLTPQEREVTRAYQRIVDRVALLERQVSPPDELEN